MNTTSDSEIKPQPLERSEMWTQLTNTISLRSCQDQVLWSIFGAFWGGANAILLVALFTTGKPPEESVGTVVSIVGFSLSVVWHIIQERALGHLERFEALMSKLEKSLRLNPEQAVSGDINLADYQKYVGKRIGVARKLMKRCSFCGAILWFFGLVYFALRAVRWI